MDRQSNDGWVLVDNLQDSRPPQLKSANMSSNEVADTTAANSGELDVAETSKPNITEDSYRIDHKPPSNVTENTDASNETIQPNITTGTAAPTAAMPTLASLFNQAGLTKPLLDRHQHELALMKHGDVSAWLDGAATPYTKLAVFVDEHNHSRVSHSRRSLTSDGSYQQIMLPNTEAGLESAICDAGTLFDEECINPLVYTQHLALSEA